MESLDYKVELEAKIREAVPEKKRETVLWECHNPECESTGTYQHEDPLNLQDVLIALGYGYGCTYYKNGDNLQMNIPKGDEIHNFNYDLTKDFHHQSEEFYTFLHQLLL